MITYILDNSDLMKKILEISNHTQLYTFDTGSTMNRGYVAFIIQISNKIADSQTKNKFIDNILGSIPEWKDFVDEDLKHKNELESKPLVNDPRKKLNSSNDDNDLEFLFKLRGTDSKPKQDYSSGSGIEENKEEEELDEDAFESSHNERNDDDDDFAHEEVADSKYFSNEKD